MFLTGFTSLSVLLFFHLSVTFFIFVHGFFIYQSPSWSLCTVFDSILFQIRFSRSTHLLMFLSLETLTSIIRTGLPILMELIDYYLADWDVLRDSLRDLYKCLKESCFPDIWEVSWWSLYLRMLENVLQLITSALLVFFLWLVKSWKNLWIIELLIA